MDYFQSPPTSLPSPHCSALWHGFLFTGYFCAIFYQIVETSATGRNEAPEFPETSDIFDDLLAPTGKVLLVGLLCFGPAIGYMFLSPEDERSLITFFSFVAAGVVYFPMAILSVIVLGYLGALSPHIVIPAILNGGKIYWLGVLLLSLIFIAKIIIEMTFGSSFIIGNLITAFVSSYFLMVNARILGQVYRKRQEAIGWL